MSQPAEPSAPYSRAFETFVDSDDDVLGLLAYSLYKASIRERIRAGQDVPRDMRTPTAAENNAYRGSAERILEAYADKVIADAEPAISEAARNSAKDEIIAEVRQRTKGGSAIFYGVVAWFISIVITVVIALAQPSWVRDFVSHVTDYEQSSHK